MVVVVVVVMEVVTVTINYLQILFVYSQIISVINKQDNFSSLFFENFMRKICVNITNPYILKTEAYKKLYFGPF